MGDEWDVCFITGGGLPSLEPEEVQFAVHQAFSFDSKIQKPPLTWNGALFHITNLRIIILASNRQQAFALPLKVVKGGEGKDSWFSRKSQIVFETSTNEIAITFENKKIRDSLLSALLKSIQRKGWEEVEKKEKEKEKEKEKDFVVSRAGVTGLLKQKEEASQKREEVLDSAFQDLESLMVKAKELVSIAEQFQARQKRENSEEKDEAVFQEYLLNMGLSNPVTKSGSGSRFHSELARQLADFLALPLSKQGMLSLPVVYASYNRARGTDLVSPHDIYSAAKLFQKLKLPVSLRKLESGVLVVQVADQTDETMSERTLKSIKEQGPTTPLLYSQQMNCSISLANYQLETAERLGYLCRDVSIRGVTFWPNIFAGFSAKSVS